jgi:hypothetical protein
MFDHGYACAVDFFDVDLWKEVIALCLEDPDDFWRRLFSCDEYHPDYLMTHVFTDQQLTILESELAANTNPDVRARVLMSWQNFNTVLETRILTRHKAEKAYYISFDLNIPPNSDGHDVDDEWLKVVALKLPEFDNDILLEDAGNVHDYSLVVNRRWDYLRAIFKSLKKKLYGVSTISSGFNKARRWMYYFSKVPNNALSNLIILCKTDKKIETMKCLFKPLVG